MRGLGSGIGPVLARAACLAAAASVAVGCGAAARTGSPGAGRTTGDAAVKHPVSASSPAEPARPPGRANPSARATATLRTLDRRMLARQPVPPGARPSAHHPPALRAAQTLGGFGSVVRVTAIYLVPRRRSAVLAFLRAHVPAGTTNVATGISSNGSQAERFVSYTLSGSADGLIGTLLVASTLPAGAGHTWLRLDAMDAWAPPSLPG